MIKPIIKFNSGMGAILCTNCGCIIKTGLTKDEWKGKTELRYCDNCLTEQVIGNKIKSIQR